MKRAYSDPATAHEVDLGHMRPGQRYYYRVTSRTPWGTSESSPTATLAMPDYGVADSRLAQWRMGNASGVAIGQRGDGELRLAASQNSATYVSRLLDVHQMVTWRREVLDADVPAGTSLRVEVRTGSTSRPDTTWTPWTAVDADSAALPSAVKPSRYLQYRLRLTGNSNASPVVRAIGFSSSGTPPVYPTESGG